MDNLVGYGLLALIVVSIGYRWYRNNVAHEANQAIRRMEKRDR